MAYRPKAVGARSASAGPHGGEGCHASFCRMSRIQGDPPRAAHIVAGITCLFGGHICGGGSRSARQSQRQSFAGAAHFSRRSRKPGPTFTVLVLVPLYPAFGGKIFRINKRDLMLAAGWNMGWLAPTILLSGRAEGHRGLAITVQYTAPVWVWLIWSPVDGKGDAERIAAAIMAIAGLRCHRAFYSDVS